MLIKSERAKTGAGKNRLMNHVFRGLENESIKLLRGTEEDVADAYRDARKHGRKFAVRHWIIAPEILITREQALLCVEWLAAEFEFDPESAVVVEHIKPRVNDENNADCHYHVLVSEVVDPASGRVLSSSQNYARHEKISRCAEIFFGHPIVSGKHNDAVIAALRREKNHKIADDLEKDFQSRPNQCLRESFTSSDHQRTARQGYDLPFLRDEVQKIMARTKNRADLESELSKLSLVVAAGDRDGVYVVRSADGVFIGSLSRLARVRKSEIVKRMEASHDQQQPHSQQTQDNYRASNLSEYESTSGEVGATRSTSSAGDECNPSQSDGSHTRPATEGGGGAGADNRAIGSERRQAHRIGYQTGDQGGHQLALEIGFAARTETVIDLLGRARKLALNPVERVTAAFNDFIEYHESAQAKAAAGLPEPASLRNARRATSEALHKVSEFQKEMRGAERALDEVRAMRGPMFSWMTDFAARKQTAEREAETRVDSCRRQLKDAESNSRYAESDTRRLERDYRVEATEFSQFWQAQAKHSARRISIANCAKQFAGRNPSFARWGASVLFNVGLALIEAKSMRDDDAGNYEAPDFVKGTDIWGVPYQPRPG